MAGADGTGTEERNGHLADRRGTMLRGLGVHDSEAGFVCLTWRAATIGGHCVLAARAAAVVGAGGVTGFWVKFAAGAGDVFTTWGAGMAELAMFCKTGGAAVVGVRCVATTWGAATMAAGCAAKTMASHLIYREWFNAFSAWKLAGALFVTSRAGDCQLATFEFDSVQLFQNECGGIVGDIYE